MLPGISHSIVSMGSTLPSDVTEEYADEFELDPSLVNRYENFSKRITSIENKTTKYAQLGTIPILICSLILVARGRSINLIGQDILPLAIPEPYIYGSAIALSLLSGLVYVACSLASFSLIRPIKDRRDDLEIDRIDLLRHYISLSMKSYEKSEYSDAYEYLLKAKPYLGTYWHQRVRYNFQNYVSILRKSNNTEQATEQTFHLVVPDIAQYDLEQYQANVDCVFSQIETTQTAQVESTWEISIDYLSSLVGRRELYTGLLLLFCMSIVLIYLYVDRQLATFLVAFLLAINIAQRIWSER